MRPRVFLLSPANCAGRRAARLLAEGSELPLALRLRSPEGASLGEAFSFMSGLYFRGKLAYAARFASPPPARAPLGVLVITPRSGLRAPGERVTVAELRGFAAGDVDPSNGAYRAPLERSAAALCDAVGGDCEIVLLGSIATGKYVDVLEPVFGPRLVFPSDFVGRGDMSRGALLLRAAASGRELPYVPASGAARRGPRAARPA